MLIETKNEVCEVCGKKHNIFEVAVQNKDTKEIKDVNICRACVFELNSGNGETTEKFMKNMKKLFEG